MADGIPGYLRIRVVKPHWAGDAEITNDLAHLHQVSYQVSAMQPGNPGSSAIGSFTIQLYPPGSPGYAANKATYDQLARWQRIELYLGYNATSIGLGKLVFAGPITGIDLEGGATPIFTLTGVSDLGWLNYSKPFPGTVTGYFTDSDTVSFAKSYFGTPEVGYVDNFNPYTAGNYTSTSLPGGGVGNWASATDEGVAVVSCSTGSSPTLLANSGAGANDSNHSVYVEVTGRLKTDSTSTTQAGRFGVGLSTSTANCNDCIVAWVQAKYNAGQYDLDITFRLYVGGVNTLTQTASNVLTSAADANGYIPLTLGILDDLNTVQVTVNGTQAFTATGLGSVDAGTVTNYPFLYFTAAATGTATAYQTNLVYMVKYAANLNPTTAAFKPGSMGTTTQAIQVPAESGPTFLENIVRMALLEGWYVRYTPLPYTVGSRVLGTLDLIADPGTDLGTARQVLFQAGDNLLTLKLSNNADPYAGATTALSYANSTGAGISVWRDTTSLTRDGVIEDQTLTLTSPNFGELRRATKQIVANKTATSSSGTSKTAVVRRDPATADKWREVDKVMIHSPELGVNYMVSRVLGYTFDEGMDSQALVLDQFGETALVNPNGRQEQIGPHPLIKRFQQAVFQVAQKFKTR